MKQTNSSHIFVQILFLLLLSGLFSITILRVWDGNKEVDTSKRDEAYSSRIERLNNAEQYTLIANKNGYYPCSHCPSKLFYLNKGETWKYGVTINGQSGRYSLEFLTASNLSYLIEFEGTLQECLEEEARKIILYYQFPENFSRTYENRLARPPGNSKDQ